MQTANSLLINDYSKIVRLSAQSTAKQYMHRLIDFEKFLSATFTLRVDDLVQDLKATNKFNVYEVLSQYHVYHNIMSI